MRTLHKPLALPFKWRPTHSRYAVCDCSLLLTLMLQTMWRFSCGPLGRVVGCACPSTDPFWIQPINGNMA